MSTLKHRDTLVKEMGADEVIVRKSGDAARLRIDGRTVAIAVPSKKSETVRVFVLTRVPQSRTRPFKTWAAATGTNLLVTPINAAKMRDILTYAAKQLQREKTRVGVAA